jgi:hypothetical protein
MKTNFLFALIITSFILPARQSEASAFYNDPDSIFSVSIGGGSTYDFSIYRKNENGSISQVSAQKQGAKEEQVFVFKDDDYLFYPEFNDYNFDGYLDMYIHDPCMILGNCSGLVYIFNPGHSRFDHDPQFDDLTTVEVSPASGEIYSLNRSAGGSLFTRDTYKWENGKLVLVKRISVDASPSGGYEYKREERNKEGKMEVIEKKESKEPFEME